MKEQDFIMKTKLIKETFKDQRKIKCQIPIQNLNLEQHIYQEGSIFITEKDEIIDLELQITDFTEDELVKYVERLYIDNVIVFAIFQIYFNNILLIKIS